MNIYHKIGEQFGQPKGFWGRIIGYRLSRKRCRNTIDWVISLLNIQSGDRILEIGYGPGIGINKIVNMYSRVKVTGVDISDVMYKQASKRNAREIASGEVKLLHGDVHSMPDNGAVYDKVFGINVIYFFDDAEAAFKKLYGMIKAGGILAFRFVPKEYWEKDKYAHTGVYSLYTHDEVVSLFREAGFSDLQSELKESDDGTCAYCVIGRK